MTDQTAACMHEVVVELTDCNETNSQLAVLFAAFGGEIGGVQSTCPHSSKAAINLPSFNHNNTRSTDAVKMTWCLHHTHLGMQLCCCFV